MITRPPRGRTGRTNRGLLPQQHEFLVALKQAGGSLNKALKKTGFRRDRFWRWLRIDPAFRDEYNGMMVGSLDAARKVMEAATSEAIGTLLDAQDAREPFKFKTTCPECHKPIEVLIDAEDWKIRIKAAELLMKGAGAIVERKKVDVESHVLNYGEMMSVLLLAGKPGAEVPPAMRESLRARGFLPEGRGEVIEGEVREITEDERVPED